MKRILRGTFLFLFLLFGMWMDEATACNLSDMTFCGYTPVAVNDTTICLRVRYGYGKTGSTKGADNDTRSVSFGWYTHKTGFLVLSFTPTQMISARGFAKCTMTGANIGAQGAPYNDKGTVIYIDPGYYGIAPCVVQPFGCVTSTASCDNVGQQTVNYTFHVNKLPDSVRVFGVEGGGNPVAGCYPNVDMKVIFPIFPVVWGDVEGIALEKSVKLKWTTLEEVNSDFFHIERASQGSDYEVIGQVNSFGTTQSPQQYEFIDNSPLPGENRYRIVQVDLNGSSDNSQTVEVHFTGPSGLVWGAVGPNPASDVVNLTFFNDRDQSMTLLMHDQTGKTVMNKEINAVNGTNSIRLALNNVDSGVYFVSLNGPNGKLTRKLIKL